ncbi:hypothetical protein V6N12_041652 [Hibiscus sabdariffa]|uniref:Uncharacterized protein n=1 Tax=Hibiscus sabdariffa TaxID=183260 RepID=A0ABR2BIK9_9ROSI
MTATSSTRQRLHDPKLPLTTTSTKEAGKAVMAYLSATSGGDGDKGGGQRRKTEQESRKACDTKSCKQWSKKKGFPRDSSQTVTRLGELAIGWEDMGKTRNLITKKNLKEIHQFSVGDM